jgi:hypothetical protein
VRRPPPQLAEQRQVRGVNPALGTMVGRARRDLRRWQIASVS